MRILLGLLVGTVAIVSCGDSKKIQELQKQAKATFGTLPAKMSGSEKDSSDRIALGKKLYFDTNLSANGKQSCNSCHNVDGKGAGVDNLPTSPGAFGKNGDRNSPTVLNAGLQLAQFWDGRAADLTAQAKGPILNPVEMAMPGEKEVVEKLSKLPDYPELFKKAFPDEKEALTYQNLAEAIAAFERTLITRDRFDDFVNGNAKALSKEEQEGLETFIKTGCASCHNGALFGGNSYRKLGQAVAYDTTDVGRFNVTKNEGEKFFFKVPMLRNVALTGPYFHDGSVKTLNEAVQKMAYHQLNIKISEEDTKKIVTFLNSLSDKEKVK